MLVLILRICSCGVTSTNSEVDLSVSQHLIAGSMCGPAAIRLSAVLLSKCTALAAAGSKPYVWAAFVR